MDKVFFEATRKVFTTTLCIRSHFETWLREPSWKGKRVSQQYISDWQSWFYD